ncbi:MAG: exodeoxyribonuclease VII small subunit [Geminicoccaceae bacterium]|nr:exodeoxyribonuclease VII small subunit [Geminicoccaceae bacterium]MCX8100927.1 exodeoxyribonuclease VII small subunit [Geminicoccaceae bacterium]MDW8368646.1 exodeoxyribonuclease VII small subunit [Geminicoccaceae bacterium]
MSKNERRPVEPNGPAGSAGASQEPAAGDKPIAAMSFEEAIAELEALVQKLERGQLDLEASIAAYERGTALRRHCAEKLREAELRVEKLSFERDGTPKLEPFAERS